MSQTVQQNAEAHDTVVVVDFGAQYAQLIARRVREANVFSVIVPHTATAAQILEHEPRAVILSGGPSSVHVEGAPQIDTALFDADVAVFGICYGFQAMAQALGGHVAATGRREYGRTPTRIIEPGTLLSGLDLSGTDAEFRTWMSHGDAVHSAPEGFTTLAATN